RAHRGAVDAVGAVQIQIVLDGRRKTARPNCCDDVGSPTSHVCQFQACDVLALRIKTVSGARTGPCYSAVIREVETGFRASGDLTTVIGVHANFTNGVILWELPRRRRESHAENVSAKHGPGISRISGL